MHKLSRRFVPYFVSLSLLMAAQAFAADSGITIGYSAKVTITGAYSFKHSFENDAIKSASLSNETLFWEATLVDSWPGVQPEKGGAYVAEFGPATAINKRLSGGGSNSFNLNAKCGSKIYGQGAWDYSTGAPESPDFKMGSVYVNPSIGMYAIASPIPMFWYNLSGKYSENSVDCLGNPSSSEEIYHNDSFGKVADFVVDDFNWLGGPDLEPVWGGRYDPKQGSPITGRISRTFDHSSSDPNNGTLASTVKIDLVFTLTFGPPPPPPPDVSDDDATCEEEGCIIGAQNQSLGQVAPIAGTPFALRYQSDRMPGRLGDAATWTAKNFAMGGWSLDAHHAYDSKAQVLYLGSGSRRSGDSVKPVPASGGGFLIPGQDDNRIFQFDQAGRHFRTLDEFTGAALFEFAYDAQGRLTSVKDNAGNLTTIQRSGDAPTAIVGPFGHRTTLSMDANSYLAKIQGSDGAVTALSYDAKGLMSSLTDPRGNVSQFTFDPTGRLTQDTGPEGNSQTFTRTGAFGGYLVQRTTSDGLTTKYLVLNPTYQTQFPDGSITSGTRTGPFFGNITGVSGVSTNTAYSSDPRWGLQAALPETFTTATPGGLTSTGALARTITLSNPANPLSLSSLADTMQFNGRSYRTEFAASKGTVTQTSPLGRQIVRTLDSRGQMVAHQVNGLAPVKFAYDTQGRLSTVTTGDGAEQRSEKYEYGTDGLLNRFTDAAGQATTYQLDKAGRLLSETFPDKGVRAFGYDASGNLTSVKPPGRPAHSFTHTPSDLLSFYLAPIVAGSGMPTGFLHNAQKDIFQITLPGGGALRRNFDSMGHVASMDFPTGQLSFSYDPKTGQTTQVSTADGNSLTYSYDGDLLLANAWSGEVSGKVERTYDSDFRLASVVVNGGTPVTLGYDDDGYLVSAGDMKLTRDATTGLLSATSLDKVTDSFIYNTFGELTQYTAAGPAGVLMTVKYSRDKLGRITDKAETIAGTTVGWRYGYDAVGRLTSVDKDGAAAARYSYDSNGNRTRVTASGANEDAIFDEQDRQTKRGTAQYDYAAGGELAQKTTAGQKTQYEYDALGNLRRVQLASGKEVLYVLDGENRRIGKKLGAALAKGFLYQDSLRPAAELDASGEVAGMFVYSDSEGSPLYLIKGDVKYRILTDILGSPRLVVNATTGQIAQRIDYDAFGNVTADSSPGFQPFGFAGGLYDPDTGLVRFGARDYDADAGRWTAKDPILFDGGDANLYAYVGNDPVNLTDRSGTTVFALDAARRKSRQVPPAPPKKATTPPCGPPKPVKVDKWGKPAPSKVKILTFPR